MLFGHWVSRVCLQSFPDAAKVNRSAGNVGALGGHLYVDFAREELSQGRSLIDPNVTVFILKGLGLGISHGRENRIELVEKRFAICEGDVKGCRAVKVSPQHPAKDADSCPHLHGNTRAIGNMQRLSS